MGIINSSTSPKHFEKLQKEMQEGSALGLLCSVGSFTRLSFEEIFKTNSWIKYPINKNLDILQESTSWQIKIKQVSLCLRRK